MLKRLAPRIVLALDADAAGDAAALRALEVVRATYGKLAVPVADRKGSHPAALRPGPGRPGRQTAGRPGPDDVIRRSPEQFRALVAAARPIVEVLIDAEAGPRRRRPGRARAGGRQRPRGDQGPAEPGPGRPVHPHAGRAAGVDYDALRTGWPSCGGPPAGASRPPARRPRRRPSRPSGCATG